MNRRGFLVVAGAVSVTTACAFRYWPDEGIWNKCIDVRLPQELADHELLHKAWEGIDPRKFWDCHTHLIGTGDSSSGIWVNPNMESLLHPIQYTQFKFYLNASCAEGSESIDEGYVDRLIKLNGGMPSGAKFMLLAFDYHYDDKGEIIKEYSPFYTPNEYAARLAQTYPEQFEWIASIHPYREDCIEALNQAVANGARAVKWLPSAMGMDPSSSLCDRFYDALIRHDIPLLTHSGTEHAIQVEGLQGLGNPLLFRRPLNRGVKVILAHCASLGSNIDIDKGPDGSEVSNFELFARLMSESAYENLLYGDISAVTQINHDISIITNLIQHPEWHHRLVNGSDYPLPGVVPVFSMRPFVNAGMLSAAEAEVISAIRVHNPMLFDFMLKRLIKVDGIRLSNSVFETCQVFDSNPAQISGL